MEEFIDLAISEIGIGEPADAFRPITLQTTRGQIAARFYHIPSLKRAAIFVGGIGGGFDTPANNLYHHLSEQLVSEGISSLWIAYRNSTDMLEAVFDVMVGMLFLKQNGFEQVGLVGHSMGGAVAIQAANNSELAKTVVCLATQGYGAEPVGNFAKDTSLLLIHGKNDIILPYYSSEYVYELAHQPKKLVLLEGNGHTLDESEKIVYDKVHKWLVKQLKKGKVIV